MNELQKVEFHLLKIFVSICSELQLNYYLVCGTALGAVKYNGFIPWDDDIDVGMPRDDYECFLLKAPELLPDNIFLQNYLSDPEFPSLCSKLRNSSTTYFEKSAAKLKINHGVYIDIFPLDGYPVEKSEQVKLEKKKKILKLKAQTAFDMDRTIKGKLATCVLRMLGCHKHTADTVNKLTNLISKYKISDSEYICNHGNWQKKLEYAPKEQYGEGIEATFEGLRVRIPEKYDEYLTQKYGDWRAELPKEQQVGHHYYSVCDLSKPYTEYQK